MDARSQSAGLFGIGKSPSLASNFPNPTVITGISHEQINTGKSISIVVPELEIETLKAGNYAVLGIVKPNICICIIPVESADIDISSVSCP